MNAASVIGAKSEIVSVLPPTTLYLLAAPSTTETIKGKIVTELENGGQPNLAAIKARVETARREVREQSQKEQTQKAKAESKKNAERAERRRLKEEAEEQERMKQAVVTAQKIIEEVGIESVSRILDADWRVHHALREAVKVARSGAAQCADAATKHGAG